MTPDITPEWCANMAAIEAAHGDPEISAGRLAADPAAVRAGAFRFDAKDVQGELYGSIQGVFIRLALDLAAARFGADCASTEVQERPYLAAQAQALRLLDELFAEHVVGNTLHVDGVPGVPESLGDFCRTCGCSDEDSCIPQCGWAGPGLCTNCDAGGVRSRAPGTGTPEQHRRIGELAEEKWLSRQRSVDGMARVLAARERSVLS